MSDSSDYELTEAELNAIREDAQRNDRMGAVARALLELENEDEPEEGIEW